MRLVRWAEQSVRSGPEELAYFLINEKRAKHSVPISFMASLACPDKALKFDGWNLRDDAVTAISSMSKSALRALRTRASSEVTPLKRYSFTILL